FAERAGFGQAPRRLDAVDARHSNVHEDDVRSKGADSFDRRGSVARLADHLEVGLRLEDHAEAGADERLVVDDQDLDGHQAGSSMGRRACTENPPAGSRPARSWPPKSATRSRIPMRPCPEAEAGSAPPLAPSSRTSRASIVGL